VTGTDQQGFDLDGSAEWWWTGVPFGPTALWMIGSLAYAALLAVLWPQLRRAAVPSPVSIETGEPVQSPAASERAGASS